MNPEPNRGIDYADGGVSDLNVYYPNPKAVRKCNDEWADLAAWNTDAVPPADQIKRFHQEWEGVTGYLNEWENDCD